MVAINPEMLRELLAEFTEKEAVNREEINVINQQLEELDKRIDANKKKLEGLTRDRDKILAMKDRYLSGNWPNVSRDALIQAASTLSVQAPAPVAEAAAPAPVVETPAPAPAPVVETPAPAPAPVVETPAPAPAPAPVVETPAPAPAPAPVVAEAPAPAPAPVAFASPERTATSTATDLPAAATPSITIPTRTHNRLQAMPPVEPPAPAAPEPVFSAPEPAPVFSAPEPAPVFSAPEPAPDLDVSDDPILSSFGGQPQAEVDIDSALSEPIEESNDQADANNDFAWTSTAVNEDASAAQQASAIEPQGWGSPTAANPWGSNASPVEYQAQQASPAPAPMPEPQMAQQAEVPAPQSGPDYGGSNPWGDFGDEEWGQPAAAAAEPQPVESGWGQSSNASASASGGGWGQSSQGDSWAAAAASQPQEQIQSAPPVQPPASSGGGWGAPAPAQAPAAQAEGGWGQPVSSQPAPQAQYQDNSQAQGHNPWGQPAPQEQQNSMQQAWGQPAQAAAQPSHLSNPWGGGDDDVASQAQTQDPATAAQEQETRSSLARAADGALISPVKGRRKSGPNPSFDWGSDEQQQ